ncbi:hypothetical protein RJZ90_001253 [Blastomyces dermatitidis]
MNLSHLVTSYYSPPSTYSHSSTSQKRQALQSEPSSLSVSNGYYDRNASNLAYARSPQPPLSPPVEDQARFSLPSISSLLQGADQLAPVHVASRPEVSRPGSLPKANKQAQDDFTTDPSLTARLWIRWKQTLSVWLVTIVRKLARFSSKPHKCVIYGLFLPARDVPSSIPTTISQVVRIPEFSHLPYR